MLSAKIVNFHKFCMTFYGFCLDLPVWPIWWHSTWYFTWVSLLRYARSVENADPKRLLSPQVLFASSSRVILATIQLIGNPIAQKYSLGMLPEKIANFHIFNGFGLRCGPSENILYGILFEIRSSTTSEKWKIQTPNVWDHPLHYLYHLVECF